MDFVVLFSWKTVLRHTGWSVAECPYCQGLEPARVEEQVFTFSIYWLPVIQHSKGWVKRCDFCERIVVAASEARPVPLDAWSPRQGLAVLLRKLGYTGKVNVRRSSLDVRLRSLLQATQQATSINNMDISIGLTTGLLVGALIAIPIGVLLFDAQLIQARVDKFGFVLVSCIAGALIGAIAGGAVHAILKRQPLARKKVRRACGNYAVDIKRLEELSREYNRVVQSAVLAVRDDQNPGRL